MIPAPDYDDYVAAAAAALDIELDGAAQRGVSANLAALFRMAAALAALDLEDELDPAPVYSPPGLWP